MDPILYAGSARRGAAFMERWRGAGPSYVCVLAHTDTCLITGLSTAGVTEDLRAYTPAADAEVVLLGEALCLPQLPSSPLGAPGPAGITRAALRLAGIQPSFVAAGLRVWPSVECARISEEPGGSIELGHAVPRARSLFEAGFTLGRDLASRTSHLVLGESVPGGTTTALAVLLALGYAAEGRVSGSMPGNAHALKTQVARRALSVAALTTDEARADPLLAVSCVGDPMQPLAAGIALGAVREDCDVMLAGGSQMLAVAALLRALSDLSVFDRIAIGTTRWIIEDPAADVVGLASEVSTDLPLLAVNLDFATSRHAGLRHYEGFLVKEGVGAGGACIAALLSSGASIEVLHDAIDSAYDELLGRLQADPV